MRLFLVSFLLSLMILPGVKAQDTLPGFSASLKPNGKVLISWRNTYPAINQISIQRSSDSLRNFTTLVSVPDPRIPENGFVDSKATGTKMYYRIFILFPNSKYLFTRSRRAKAEPVEQPSLAIKSPPKDKPKTPVQPGQEKQIKAPGDLAKIPAVKPPEEEEKYLILPKIDNSRIYYMAENTNLKKPSVNNPGKIKTPTIEV